MHAAHAAGAASKAPESLKGYAYPFASGGPEPPPGVRHPDFKQWDKFYAESLQPTLVRL